MQTNKGAPAVNLGAFHIERWPTERVEPERSVSVHLPGRRGANQMKEQVAEIVAAYLRNNSVAPSDIPAVITQVYQSLAGLGQPQPVEPEAPDPAVPIRRSVTPEYVVCLDCGAKGKMLKRHLLAAHSLTPAEYRERWKLPTDHPLVAPGHSARRSEMAKALGLGRRPDTRGRPSKRARKRVSAECLHTKRAPPLGRRP
jgi:predicted transcriptional regulator